jgi:hypothetical protein
MNTENNQNQNIKTIPNSNFSQFVKNLSNNSYKIKNLNDESFENVDEIKNKLCHKCYQKKKSQETISKIEIFNRINYIVFNSFSMPDVYNKMDNLILPFGKWLELNEEGYSVFHWFSWFISTKIKKYQYIKPKVYAFFQKVFSDNTIDSIFSEKQISSIIKLTNPKKPSHNLLYHLVRHCENPNDVYYKRLYKLLLDNGCEELTDEQLIEIKNSNTEEENLPDDLKLHVFEITNKYKCIEDLIIQNVETKYTDYKLTKCVDCNCLIDYIKEIPNIITYAKDNNCDLIINLIWFAYYQRKLLNKIFDNYYKMTKSCSELNQIHKRHSHILEIYSNNLIIGD